MNQRNQMKIEIKYLDKMEEDKYQAGQDHQFH